MRMYYVVNVANPDPKRKDIIRVFDKETEADTFEAEMKAKGMVTTRWEL